MRDIIEKIWFGDYSAQKESHAAINEDQNEPDSVLKKHQDALLQRMPDELKSELLVCMEYSQTVLKLHEVEAYRRGFCDGMQIAIEGMRRRG